MSALNFVDAHMVIFRLNIVYVLPWGTHLLRNRTSGTYISNLVLIPKARELKERQQGFLRIK